MHACTFVIDTYWHVNARMDMHNGFGHGSPQLYPKMVSMRIPVVMESAAWAPAFQVSAVQSLVATDGLGR